MRVAPVFLVTLLTVAAAGASSAQAAGFGCSASSASIQVLDQPVVAPLTANPAGSPCAGDVKTLTGAAAGITGPVSIGGIVAATEVYSAEKAVLSSGGLADLKVSTLPDLPITLPPLPDAVKAAVPSVDLTGVKTAIPTLPTNLVTNLPTNLPTNTGTPVDSVNAALNATNLAQNTANTTTNAINNAINLINASIPNSVDVDALLDGLLKLPNLELLRIKAAMAYAAGSCQTGSPVVSSESTVAGVSILGQDVNVGQSLDRLLSVELDPAQIAVTLQNLGLSKEQTDVIAGIGAATTALNAALASVNSALQTALAAADLPDLPLQIRIVPGAETKTGDSVTRKALSVTVTLAGVQLLDASIGEAMASAAGVNCSDPVLDPSTPAGATLGCGGKRLVLVDVLERNGRVKLNGVADPSLVGQKVAIVFGATGRTVARAKVNRDGTFDTTAPLPPRGMRDSNDARYMATLGDEESINLKLRRRMIVTSMTSKDGRVTIAGRVVRPLATPVHAITVSRRVSCTKEVVVTRFKPKSNGRFRTTFKAPKGVGSAVYRMTTKVRFSETGSGLFETYTLPRAVDLS